MFRAKLAARNEPHSLLAHINKEYNWDTAMKLCLALFLLSYSLFAQSDRGTVTGRVIDATSAAVPNASVVVTNQETGLRSTTRTSETGN